MNEQMQWPTRPDFFLGTGFVFVSPQVWPELAEIGVVQRFASETTEHVHEVRFGDGLECSCPGWRKYAKCWHMRFVVRYNVGSKWSLGAFVKAMPTSLEWPNLAERSSRKAWLRENIAVVRREDFDANARRRSDVKSLVGLDGPEAPSRGEGSGRAVATCEVHDDVARVEVADWNGDWIFGFASADGTDVDEHATVAAHKDLKANRGLPGMIPCASSWRPLAEGFDLCAGRPTCRRL